MRYWTGLVLFVAAGWLIQAGLAHRRRILAVGGAGDGASARSIDTLGYIFRPIILFALVYVGIKSAFVYWVLDGGRYLSLVDLAGFLCLLAGYGTWAVLKTKYRARPIAAPEVPQVPAEAANDPIASPHAAGQR
jgi:hypothetical protein